MVNLNLQVGIRATIVVDCVPRAVRGAKKHASVRVRSDQMSELKEYLIFGFDQ